MKKVSNLSIFEILSKRHFEVNFDEIRAILSCLWPVFGYLVAIIQENLVENLIVQILCSSPYQNDMYVVNFDLYIYSILVLVF